MSQRELDEARAQMDYFSESYARFEEDFYRYSALEIPLTFLTDDLLKVMVMSQKSYFKLNKEKSRDGKDHYFTFRVHEDQDNPVIWHYEYRGHQWVM